MISTDALSLSPREPFDQCDLCDRRAPCVRPLTSPDGLEEIALCLECRNPSKSCDLDCDPCREALLGGAA